MLTQNVWSPILREELPHEFEKANCFEPHTVTALEDIRNVHTSVMMHILCIYTKSGLNSKCESKGTSYSLPSEMDCNIH